MVCKLTHILPGSLSAIPFQVALQQLYEEIETPKKHITSHKIKNCFDVTEFTTGRPKFGS